MKKIFLTVLIFVFGTISFAADIQKLPAEGRTTDIETALAKHFDESKFNIKGNTVEFTGKVKANSIFPEKDTFFDMQYSTIEESQFEGNSETLYNRYISGMSEEDNKKSGFNDKRLLASEKYYNIMEILDQKAAGSSVTIVFTASTDGKNAVIQSFNASKLFMYNESARDLLRFIYN